MAQLRGIVNYVLATVLALLLVWGFSPLSASVRSGLTVFILLLSIPGIIYGWRQYGRLTSAHSAHDIPLPPESFSGPVVLVCGDTAPLFAGRGDSCESSQGWYLSVQSPEHYNALVRRIAVQRPGLLMRVSVMLALIPERHNDGDALKHMLLSWRRVVTQSRRWLSGIPPFWLCCWLNSPQCNETVRWFIRTPQDAEVQSATGLDDCVPFSLQEHSARHSHLTHAVWLDTLLGWLKRVQGDAGHHVPPLFSALRVTCFTSLAVCENNLWQRHITDQTTISPAASAGSELLPFPDLALPFLSRRRALTALQRTVGISGLLCGIFVGLAMTCSFINNQHLIRVTNDHLTLYRHLSGNTVEPKIQAQDQLRRDAQRLDRWYRRGEPLSLSMGLYQGMRLIPPLQAAISDWLPPEKPKATSPQTVRLDSMSLFDTGKWALKAGSTKVLIRALVNIKARPGWLIVIAGHTDDVGDDKSNQQLSLKRAESVRDWMRDTGDVAESCFAVQGYGESHPYKTNDTLEGRAANRRVEISLVPQADACRVPGMKEPSPEGGDALAK
ncbi:MULTISPECIES: OmpA family protein [unclassified Citrobacter]|uniref:OmpA family protein n=1 Tax=unclassified Citrobacter TaxID=2644389 RepID=UPI001B38BBF5|nr:MULTISPECIES: OmpA family protein [unclassified Citrobacter]MBP8543919.1 OmpA family protein [Citrobacter sp. On2M]MBW5274871.1 OmpA family protein [Citrobacter sp. On28M]